MKNVPKKAAGKSSGTQGSKDVDGDDFVVDHEAISKQLEMRKESEYFDDPQYTRIKVSKQL